MKMASMTPLHLMMVPPASSQRSTMRQWR
uniref:Truncated capsid protein n=1 Tax=Norovirus Hu/GII/Tianjin/510/2009/CHN TaxID=666879 RepID=C8CBA5_NORV|nr:truncated capsid protein [Norovirus Hu/GII/Tianjin/510/2009/CHN]